MLPEDKIADELNKFFANTLARHGSTQWDDVQSPSVASSARGFDISSTSSETRLCSEDMSLLSLSGGLNKDMILGSYNKPEMRDERERFLVKDAYSRAGPFYDSTGDKNVVSGYFPGEEIKNVATSGGLGMPSNGSSHCTNVRTSFSNSLSGKHLTHSNLGFLRENGKIENRISCTESALNSVIDDEKDKHNMLGNSICSNTDEKNMALYGSAVLNSPADNFNNVSAPQGDRYTSSFSEGSETSRDLLDLTGDYESNIRNLQYGQICHGYAVSPLVVPSPPMSPKLQNRNPWDTVRQCLQINHHIHPQTNSNGVVVGQQLYVVNHPSLPMASFGPEEKRKPRGTGAYFPNMVYV